MSHWLFFFLRAECTLLSLLIGFAFRLGHHAPPAHADTPIGGGRVCSTEDALAILRHPSTLVRIRTWVIFVVVVDFVVVVVALSVHFLLFQGYMARFFIPTFLPYFTPPPKVVLRDTAHTIFFLSQRLSGTM